MLKRNWACSFAALALTLLSGLGAGKALGGEVVTYYHNDIAGSPLLATNVYGQVAWRAGYEPYGERIQTAADQTASAYNARWYTGHVQDFETDLVYMEARYYDPLLGRFMGTDPIAVVPDQPHTFNRYSYAWNNPYRYTDPDGEFINFIGGGVKAALENLVIQTVEIKLGLRQEFSFGELAADAALGTVTSGLSTLKNTGRLIHLADKVLDRVDNINDGKHIFWSGIPGGAQQAAEWAARHGGTTLSTSKLPKWDPNNPAVVAAWTRASKDFAANAKGDVVVLQGDKLRSNAIFRDEFAVLKENQNVTSITAVNPETGAEILLWKK